MAKFVFTYSGGGEMPQTDAEREAVMSAWTGWFAGLGSAVLDAGNPFAGSSTVTASGATSGSRSGMTGYSIVHADDRDAAAEMAKGCPLLSAPGGAVEVHEALDM